MRYICVHGHFYQPPRENPWLEAIERQISAYPYHDWNARIDAECYSQNGASRILAEDGTIERIVNNYARISFNFGPTLLSWLEEKSPGTYASILEADRESLELFSGHGSAMAQSYNHAILPLCNPRDRRTQVAWGIRDFRHRFGRDPEGMWLPETAVDLATLEELAAQGIRFTVLAPHQARRVRPLGGRSWRSASHGRIDPSMAYLQRLPSGREIALFFYDGPVARAVAFEGLLESGTRLAHRLLDGHNGDRDGAQLAHIATDGESYGHHHRFGDMALAFALERIRSMEGVTLTNYGEFLERHPPTHEVSILEETAWSCAHGVGRWKEDCGCSSGGNPGWSQAWRGPLRAALDWLRDEMAPLYEDAGGSLFRDPWGAREAYIDVVLDRSPEKVGAFLDGVSTGEAGDEARARRLQLLEMQRHAMLMYTSCGWFFDDLSGIETVQVIQYAARSIQLAGALFGRDLESPFLERLEQASSNIPERGTGRKIYDDLVRPTMISLAEVGAHYAVSSLFRDYPESAEVYCYTAGREAGVARSEGKLKMGAGQVRITSRVTLESARMTYGALHMGDHNVVAGVRGFISDEAFQGLVGELEAAFQRAETAEVVRILDRHFEGHSVSLSSLFTDEQAVILEALLKEYLEDADRVYQRLYQSNAPLMRFLAGMKMPVPQAFQLAAERAINHRLKLAIEAGATDAEGIDALLVEASERNVALDQATLAFAMKELLDGLAADLRREPTGAEALEALDQAVTVARRLPFEVVLWEVQNTYWGILEEVLPDQRAKAEGGDEAAARWLERFVALGGKIRIRAS